MALAAPPGRGRVAPQKAKTQAYRSWKGVNLTDFRTDLEDDELAWMENAVTIGRGAIVLTPTRGATLATIEVGIAKVFGFTVTLATVATPLFLTVNEDGSATQVLRTTGAETLACAAGTLTTRATATIWRDSTILIVDPTKGYFSWVPSTGTFTTIDATKLGVAIAVAFGRVWIANARTVLFTAPNTFNDFSGAAGAGSTIITDEAFPGQITVMRSVVEQLWLGGEGAFEAISNVVTTSGVTTFSVTNILTGLGTSAPASVIGYFRSLVFLSTTGMWALAGVTPQKLSDKLDGMFPGITTVPDAPSATANVHRLTVLCTLVTYTQSLVPSLPKPASELASATPLLLCFSKGIWFFATQGALTWITTVLHQGTAECWGTDGQDLYEVFGGAEADAVPYKVQSKLYSFGDSTAAWQLKRSGLEFNAPLPIDPTMRVDNGTTSEIEDIVQGNDLIWINAVGDEIIFTNEDGDDIFFYVQGFVLSRYGKGGMFGNYLGWTLSGTDPPFRLVAVHFEIAPAGPWLVVGEH